MKVKSYFAGSADAAIRLARQQMLLSSRASPDGARYPGAFEVVLAASEAPVAPRPEPSPSAARSHAIRTEIDALRRQVDRLCASVPRNQTAAGPFADFAGQLDSQEVAPDLIARIVGPPGAGKTSTLIHLAVAQGPARGDSGVMISADGSRDGGAGQLRAFASIVGLPLEAKAFPESLDRLLAAHVDRPRTWIDTPGYSPADLITPPEICEFFRRHPAFERHLVLSAAMRPADLTSVVDRFAGFEPAHLLCTHLDEASAFGPLPLSCFSQGTRIPDDFEDASPARLASLPWATRGEPTAPRPPLERGQVN